MCTKMLIDDVLFTIGEDSFWLRSIIFTLIALLILFTLRGYDLRRASLKRAISDQREIIRRERQRISSEIHDEIGSGLFGIQLLAETIQKRNPGVNEIHQLNSLLKELSAKIREVIWSTNTANDNLESLIFYILGQLTLLFEHSDIQFTANIPESIPDIDLDSTHRKHIYLIVKEFAHNTVRHSAATDANMTVRIEENFSVIVMKDNGIGFERDLVGKGMGLSNAIIRTKQIKGELLLQNVGGTVATLKAPIMSATLKELVSE